MFVDRVELRLTAGKGGNGVIAWRREKFIPKGGPAGGNGGRGGSIILQSDSHTLSLEGFRNKRLIKADDGQQGGSNTCAGKGGKDLILAVAPGTIVRSLHDKRELFEFTEPGQRWQICTGGKGGRGNATFRTPTHQAPAVCTPGTDGDTVEVELELKLMADVGFVGMPNAGKSTLISQLADIRVKIAPYPFTTLHPNLGLIEFDDYSRILIADIPGIIEGAHLNRGLGLSFLRHIERTSVLVYLIELAPDQERNPWEEFQMLRRELEFHDATLLQKPFLVVVNKIDLEGAEPLRELFQSNYPFPSETLFEISAKEGIGLPQLKEAIRQMARPIVQRAIFAKMPL
jgi:GTP-binding protein